MKTAADDRHRGSLAASVTSIVDSLRSRRGTVLLVGCAALMSLTACAEPEEQSLCPAYDQFLATRDSIREVEPEDANAEEVTELFETYLQRIVRMQEVADGRYTAELDALEAATDDVLRTLASVPDDADYGTWEPLIEESLEDVRNASARFEEAIEPTCTPLETVTTTDSSEP